MAINRVFICGRLGQTPQLKVSESGASYTILKIATRRYFVKEEDMQRETTDWHDVFVWGRQGENCHKFLTKGQVVSVEGYLKTYSPSNEAEDKYNRSVIQALQVDFLGTKPVEHNLTKDL